MPEPCDKQFKTAATEMWAAYNGGMAELFCARCAAIQSRRHVIAYTINRPWKMGETTANVR